MESTPALAAATSPAFAASLPIRLRTARKPSKCLLRAASVPSFLTACQKGSWDRGSPKVGGFLQPSLPKLLSDPHLITSTPQVDRLPASTTAVARVASKVPQRRTEDVGTATPLASECHAILSSAPPSVLPDTIPATEPEATEVIHRPKISLMDVVKMYSIEEVFTAAPNSMRANLSDVEYVANGAYGSVYKAKQAKPKCTVAIKHYRGDGDSSALREDNVLRLVQGHRSVVRRLDFQSGRLQSWLLMEALVTTVSDWRRSFGASQVDMDRVRNITRDILSGVEFLQSKRVLHLDIKGDNVGLDHRGQAKLFDFGTSLVLPLNTDVAQSWRGTEGLSAPEQARHAGVSFKTDILAVGLVVHFMISGQIILLEIDEKTPEDKMERIFNDWIGLLQKALGEGVRLEVTAFLFTNILVFKAENRKGFPGIWESCWLAGEPLGNPSDGPNVGEKRKSDIKHRLRSAKKNVVGRSHREFGDARRKLPSDVDAPRLSKILTLAVRVSRLQPSRLPQSTILMAPTAPAAQPSEGLIDRIQNFVSENKTVVLAGVAVVAVGGVGYYVYSQRGGQPKSGSSGSDSLSAKDSDGSRKRRKGSSKKKVTDADGPILEERKPKEDEPKAVPDSPTLTPTEIGALSKEERTTRAQSYKSRGNAAYQKREFHRAIDLYTKAINVAPSPEAVYYSNRAACYVNLSPPQYENVVQDCTEALKLDKTYVKALNRRATALEGLNRDVEALQDFTATTILEKFQNENTTQALEKCLKKMAVARTEETLASREPRLPSYTFINAYLAAFRPKPAPTLPTTPSRGDQTLILAHDALAAADYTHAFTLINESIDQGISWKEGQARALNLRGTFKFVLGDTPGAKEDLQQSIDLLPSFTQTWVKIASVHMEMGETRAAFDAFDSAILHNPDDPDIFYHRGQVHFIMQNFDAASEDYNKSTALDNTFVFSHIQYAVAQYKKNEPETAKSSFRKTMQLFPDRSEVLNYYGELLLDLQRYQDAVEKFERAMELEKAKGKSPINVLPLVNKALAVYQWRQDIEQAQRLCEEALELDPECDAAIATLAQLYLQTSRLDDALSMFERNIQIARTGPELEQCFTFQLATQAQKEFSKQYPVQARELEQMAKAMSAMPAPGQ